MKISIFTFILSLLVITGNIAFTQTPVIINIDLTKGQKPVSPFIYGKNNVLPSTFLSTNTTAEITKAREAGVRFVRQGGGNNSTKYNWRLKLSSHPDWYNNVYPNDWDGAAKNLFDKMPGVQGMWSFQLLGKAAANTPIILTMGPTMSHNGGQALVRIWQVAENPILPIQQAKQWKKVILISI